MMASQTSAYSSTSVMTASVTTSVTSASVTTASDTSYTNPLIQSLWSDAESLLSSYYPSTTITNIASLSWPGTVVLGSSTYILTTETSTASKSSTRNSTPAPTEDSGSTSSATSSGRASEHADRRLGIGLGIGLGCVALGILIVLLWLAHRRRVRARVDPDQSAYESDMASWRTRTTYSADFPEKYITAHAPRPPVVPMMSSSTLARNMVDGRETRPPKHANGERNPFYTPHESYAELAVEDSRQQSRASLVHELHGNGSMQTPDAHLPATPITRATMPAVGPSSPHTVALMRSPPVSPISPDGSHDRGLWRSDYGHQQGSSRQDEPGLRQQSRYSNPFTSPEDYELDSPPIVPARSPRRRGSPMVHYPSGDELSTFNFGLEARLANDEQVET